MWEKERGKRKEEGKGEEEPFRKGDSTYSPFLPFVPPYFKES